MMQCERFAQLPLKAHFVFEGRGHPSTKYGAPVDVDPFKAILDVCGFTHSEVHIILLIF